MDEEVAESWEEAAENGEMEKRLAEKLRISQREKESSNHLCPRSPLSMAMVIQDDALPSAPPPQIRILKRPTNNGSLASSLSHNRPTPQVKSLAQREAEYAEARKRILGSACPEETAQDKNSTDRSARSNNNSNNNNSSSSSSTMSTSDEDVRANKHTVRPPSSPDGTRGFRQHR
ncbi:SUZ domain-containing protein 1-like isoform X1 [Entelurus aequoreus]|uniref:SUZ domain-containing protein 1-like isoform X1 n=2 Tax=Entelurus aequoreus TaxID=161455 RepID=UPI002B1D8591|nr:SUZ domain-containing protein 1-like isoform X1 [Entelurus aequoreus]